MVFQLGNHVFVLLSLLFTGVFSKKNPKTWISKVLSVSVTSERSHADLTSVTEITELERFQASCPLGQC